MRIAIGIIVLLFGLYAFWRELLNLDFEFGLPFILGSLLPSSAIIVLGAAILTWGKKWQKG